MWYKLQHLKLYYCIFGISMNPEFFSDLMNHDFELCYNSAWPCQCHLLEMNKDQINTLLITICSQMLRLSSIYMLPFAVARLWALVSLYIALLFERFGNFLVNILKLVTTAVFRWLHMSWALAQMVFNLTGETMSSSTFFWLSFTFSYCVLFIGYRRNCILLLFVTII